MSMNKVKGKQYHFANKLFKKKKKQGMVFLFRCLYVLLAWENPKPFYEF